MLERGKDKEIEGDYMISLKDTGLFRKVTPAEIQKMMKCSGAVTKEFNAVANTQTMILLLPWRFFFGFCSNACEHHQQLIRNMLEIMAVRNFDMTKKAHILSSTTLREKISVWLLETMEDGVADTGMNREQMAAYLGVTRPSLSREMMKMQKEGIFQIVWKKMQEILLDVTIVTY